MLINPMKEIAETSTTVQTKEDAIRLINTIKEHKVFACAQITQIESFYFWKNEFHHENEILITFKHSTSHTQSIYNLIKEYHPYQTPQVTTKIIHSSDEYAKWVENPETS